METIHNKYSIGKFLRKCKKLRKSDARNKEKKPEKALQDYIDYLVKNGLKINKVSLGLFYTKNGLPYPGLIAKQKLLANEIFISMP